MIRQQKQLTALVAAAILGATFFLTRKPKAGMTHAPAVSGDKLVAINRPAVDTQPTQGTASAAPDPSAILAAAAASALKAEASDPIRLQAAREAFLGLIKIWEGQNATPLKGIPGADVGGMIIMHLPPVDEATLASATRLLDEHGIPEGQRKKKFFEWAGLVGKHRYVSYIVNPADPAGTRDTMWMACMGDTDSVRIDPLTGALEMTPRMPGDAVLDLPLKDGLERYSHLFSFSTAE
ncbi:MAG: hypothetical protein V4675_08630 [Verrucomicrobiota bacterium]